MKKIIAILVAAALMLSGISAFAALTPAEEGAIYRAAINAKLDNPDFIVRHFDSIAALTTEELALIDNYFAAIDDAVKVAVTNVDINLADSQKVAIFANLNAIAKLLKISFAMKVEVPDSYVVTKEEVETGVFDYSVAIKTVFIPVTVDEFINLHVCAAVETSFYGLLADAEEAILADADYSDDSVVYEPTFALADYDFLVGFFCEEGGVCVSVGGLLSTAYLNLGYFTVSTRDSMFAANSPIRAWFADLQKVVKAVAAYKPAAAAPAPAADRLPDTATSYGNLVVLGVVMMVVAAAAVIGVKKVVRA